MKTAWLDHYNSLVSGDSAIQKLLSTEYNRSKAPSCRVRVVECSFVGNDSVAVSGEGS